MKEDESLLTIKFINEIIENNFMVKNISPEDQLRLVDKHDWAINYIHQPTEEAKALHHLKWVL